MIKDSYDFMGGAPCWCHHHDMFSHHKHFESGDLFLIFHVNLHIHFLDHNHWVEMTLIPSNWTAKFGGIVVVEI